MIAKPLTNLLKKTLPFLWTEECTTALTTLRDIVTSEPVLISPDQDHQFILEVDTSQYVTGAILYQADKNTKDRKGKPILRPCGYHSQTFSATEQQYQEFLAVICGLKHWDYLLKCAKYPVLVITDHVNLTYYRHPHKIGQRVARYIGKYKQYNIQLAYRPRALNRADALSRWPDYAPNPYNNEPVIALLEHLFIPPNTPTIELQTHPFRARTLHLDAAGTKNSNPKWDIDAAVCVFDIEDEILN